MFGYVTAYKPELKMKDFATYKAYYCGLCKTLQKDHGFKGQMLLSYDMTFLIILLTSLYETATQKEMHRCMVHPIGKREMLMNEITEYVADINIILSYYHFADDWEDEKSKIGYAGTKVFQSTFRRMEQKYPQKSKVIKDSLKKLHDLEKQGENNVDLVAGCFGDIMAEIFAYKDDIWEAKLRKTGFFLGKFVYIMDAYDDISKDMESGSYNPLKDIYLKSGEQSIWSDFEVQCNTMLTMMMAECTESFEKLPCVVNVDILRNILYVGVWNQYDKKRKGKYEENDQFNQDKYDKKEVQKHDE